MWSGMRGTDLRHMLFAYPTRGSDVPYMLVEISQENTMKYEDNDDSVSGLLAIPARQDSARRQRQRNLERRSCRSRHAR